jgi:aerobic carbon-monoxide dehydrogenase small subunit
MPLPPDERVSFTVNNVRHCLEAGRDFDPADTLASVLKNRLGLTGLKVACDEGACGACTVIMNGDAVLSCSILAIEVEGADILTIEGMGKDDPVIGAFSRQSEPGYGTAIQCGYCTPGFVMAAKALLMKNPHPALDEIKEKLAGNLCRCGCYPAITQAVLRASGQKTI